MSVPQGLPALNAAVPAGNDREARVRAAIAQAADRTGVDFSYLLAQAKLESRLDPNARARTSSATGLYQFIDSTWLQTLDRHGASFGLADAANAITIQKGRAKVSHGESRAAILAMRYNPETSALMAGALAQDNAQMLQSVLGRDPDPAELYLAHFLGARGASNFLSRMSFNPDQSAATLMPKAARANRAIFYERSGAARSLDGVMQLIRGKMAAAGAGSEVAPGATGSTIGFPIAAFNPAAGRANNPVASSARSAPFGGLVDSGNWANSARPARPSMASMLELTFSASSSGESGSMPGHVRAAYQKLKAFDL